MTKHLTLNRRFCVICPNLGVLTFIHAQKHVLKSELIIMDHNLVLHELIDWRQTTKYLCFNKKLRPFFKQVSQPRCWTMIWVMHIWSDWSPGQINTYVHKLLILLSKDIFAMSCISLKQLMIWLIYLRGTHWKRAESDLRF